MKNPKLAALLNIIPGLGYLYVGRRILFGVLVLFASISFVATQVAYEVYMFNYPVDEGVPIPVESITGLIYSLAILAIPALIGAFMYDAYQDAKYWNKSNKSSCPVS